MVPSFLQRERTVAAPGYSRWLIPPAALAVHQVGAIHGRLLTAWAAAGVAGPLIVNAFLDARGTPGELVAADYRPALLTMVGVLAVGFVANLLVRPVHERFHEPRSSEPLAGDRDREEVSS